MVKTCFFFLIVCCGTSYAQQQKAVRSPFFQGEALPTPSQQNTTWSYGDDALSKAAATLFKQGLADPRGLEYREIEIAVGSPWDGGGYPVKTHGWIFPKAGKDIKFAVAWNGLVYPVLRVGAAADLHADWTLDPKLTPSLGRIFSGTSEAGSVNFTSPDPLMMVLLLRLGEVETVNRMSKLAWPEEQTDPYLQLASDWTWLVFERAVCAHERGDDRLALADTRMLASIQPLIEAEAKRRGFEPNPDHKLPYLPFLTQLPALLADCERRVTNQKNPVRPKKGVAALIEDLQNVDARQWGQPGGVSLAQDPRVEALVKSSNEVIEPLLNAMENDDRLTRSVSFGRDFHRSRHLISVSEAAYAALVDLLRVEFKTCDENGELLTKKKLTTQIRAYWEKMGNLPPTERFYAMLKDDSAGKKQWLQAAANIVQPTGVESHGGWTTSPDRKPGQKIELRGESLRDGRIPSVSQLMAQRSDDIAAIRTASTQDHFLYLDAGQMALDLADWDKTAAIPTLKKRLMRAWSIGAEPNDILAFNGNPVEHFGTMIAKMTLSRARCGDEEAYDEYAAWIQRVELKGVSFGNEELQKTLIQGADRPSIKQAIDYLFNNPKSPWSDVLAEGNGFWVLGFWKSSLPKTTEFRKQARRGLADKTIVGSITFYPRKDWDSRTEAQIELKGMGCGFSGSNNDPDTPLPGEKRSFRICDAYAYFYSQFQKGPKFQLFWPEIKRDAGVLLCQKWLVENQ